MTDCLVENARVVTNAGLQRGSIAIEDGSITAIDTELSVTGADAETVVQADGMVALPGAIDVHTHMHDPSLFPDDIDFASQTESAVAGGVTTVVELPTQTPVTTPAAVREKRDSCADLAHIDFGLVAGNVQETDIDVEGIVEAGVPDFKTFTADPYRADDETILDLMTAVGAAGGSVRVHCESQAILDRARDRLDGTDPELYPRSRPIEAELEAISRVGWLAEYADCPLHVVHISSGSGAAVADRFKSRANVPVTLETCPQYLGFSTEDVERKGPFLKVNPSLKSATEVERLWQALRDGTIDLVATDHFPTHRADRERGWEDIWEPYAGLPGVETMLEFLASEGVHEGRISWPRLLELVCARPAREAGVFPRKGSLEVGTDADIVLLRNDPWEVSADELTYNGGWTPFEGRTWSWRVDTVITDGEIAAREHDVVAKPGDGSYLSRGPRIPVE
ncbi:dihydroorotase [Natrinema halophilum]|uniref:dihydroorotase n=1 Tax=Natrinema halophilum TaxID=1699371 RepID=UPI001F47A7F7|nr:dihydroorotase family protein [Natrinema halophilum]UHQ96162.1 dihydroorotase family protein [Natrinema halophilum]